MGHYNDKEAIFQQIKYLYAVIEEMEHLRGSNDPTFMLIQTVISNLWELKNEKYGGRPVYDLKIYQITVRGGVDLLNSQIEFLQKHIPFFQVLMNDEIKQLNSIIFSLEELKSIKGWK